MQKRAPNACDGCRARKIRCDSENKSAGEACSKCVQAEIACTFTYKRKKRKPNVPKNQHATTFDSAQALIEEILSSPDTYIAPSDPATIRDIIISIAKYARSIEESLARSRVAVMRGESPLTQAGSSLRESASPPSAYSSEESDGDHINNELFKQISLGHSDDRHWGRSSNFRFIYSAMNLSEGKVLNLGRHKRWEYWDTVIWNLPKPLTPPPPPYNFPQPDLLWHLIDIYFTETAPYLPLIHGPTFKRAVTDGLHLLNHNFGAVLLAVVAIASRSSEDPRVLLHDTRLTAGWQWFRQIRLLRPNLLETTCVYELQLYCLAYVYLQHTNMWDSVWAVVGLGLRLAIDKGIHRLKHGSVRTAETELRIRAFWTLRTLDITQGLTLGRPPATTSEEFDLDNVTECDDEYWDNTGLAEPFTQPVGKVSLLSFYTHYLKLMEIAASVQKSIYSIKGPEFRGDNISVDDLNRQKVMEQDSALNNWLASLPDHLQWDPHQPNEIFLNQSAILRATYYWVQIQVQKNFIVRPGSTRSHQSFPSLAICALAARSTVRIVQVLHRRSKSRMTSVVVGRSVIYVAQATIILVLILWRHRNGIDSGLSTDMKAVASDVSIAIDLLAAAEVTSQTIGRIRDKLMAFAEAELGGLSNIPASTTVKRARDGEVDGHLASNPEQPESNIDPIGIGRPQAGAQRATSYMTTVDTGQASSSSVNLPLPNLEFPATRWTDGMDLFGTTDANSSTSVGSAFDELSGAFGRDGQTALSANDLSVLTSDITQNELTQHDWDNFMKDIDDVMVSIWA